MRVPEDRESGRAWKPAPAPLAPPAAADSAGPIRIGYARCSTARQELASQLDALAQVRYTRVFSEKISTRVKVRPDLEAALHLAREIRRAAPDQAVILTVHELKRLARNAAELMTLSAMLQAEGIRLELLTARSQACSTPTAWARCSSRSWPSPPSWTATTSGTRPWRASSTGSPAALLGALDVHVGLLNISRGRLDEAAGRLTATCASSEAAGESWILSYATDGLGFVALMRGDLALARRHARRSLELTTRFEDTVGLSLALDLAAWTAAAGGEHERAAVLLGAASARWFSFGQQLYGSPDWQGRRDHYQQQARRCLGEAAFEAAFRRGTLMTGPT